MKTRPVSITGMGCICAPGNTIDECMDALFRGERNPGLPLRFVPAHSETHPVFNVEDDLTSLATFNTPVISRTGKLGLKAAFEAIANAGLTREELKGRRVGVCMGTTTGGVMNSLDFYRAYLKDESPDVEAIGVYLRSNPAFVIARELELDGPCQTVVNACSSSTDAIAVGAMWIRAGLCDIVLAGGADELSHVAVNGFISLMITDTGPCRPFDRDRKGLNLGEGAAMLVLESDRSRDERGAQEYSCVLGYGASCDAYHLTAPHPEGKGLRRALTDALTMSGFVPDDIAFVNAHGTATPDNDRVESQVLSEVLPGVPFLSTKGYTGHTLGAAGAIEAAFTVASLLRGAIPSSVGFENQDPDLPVCPVTSVTPIKKTVAISESLAFGGHNGVLVLGKKEVLS